MAYYTMQELADEIGVPYYTLRRWVAQGWVKPLIPDAKEKSFNDAGLAQARAIKDKSPELLTTDEAIAYLGVGRRRFYELVAKYKLRRKKLNARRVFYHKDQIDRVKQEERKPGRERNNHGEA